MTAVRVQLGETDHIPDICGRCGAPHPRHSTVLRLRRPVLVDGQVAHRTASVPIGYCARCYRSLRRYDPAVRRVWTLAVVLAALLLVAQLLMPRSDDVLELRAALPWAALTTVVLAGFFHLWANSLMSTRFPIRLIDFGVHGYTLAIDNPDVALQFERLNRPTPIRGPVAAWPEPSRLPTRAHWRGEKTAD